MPSPPSALAVLIDFPPYRLDLRAGQLCRVGTPVRVRPKTFAVLQHLAERPGELVTKQALLDAVWGDVAVSEDVVRLSVGELREILGDTRAAPRFIETVPRRGYRFIATMGDLGTRTPPNTAEPASDGSFEGDAVLVGRARERGEIAEWLRAAASGRRQVGFVSGEAGIGKTTLVDAALGDLRRTFGARLRIGRGQCVEHYGGGEPYLPLLEALTSLCRGPDGPSVAGMLRDHAPDWLLDAVGSLAPRARAGTEPAASAPDHASYRLTASLEALAAENPLLLLLEDVQWTDYSTLDILSFLAQRHGPARLLILCTLRPVDAIVRGHPIATVKRELLRKGLCREILLDGLSPADVASYLAARFPGADMPEHLGPLLVDRSHGNPFFLEVLLDHLLEQRLLVNGGTRWELRAEIETLRTAIPAGVRAVIEPRLERLPAEELHVLEAASVAGLEFAAHAVACVAPGGSRLADVEYVERLCARLARRQEILRVAGEGSWPDGTTSARYAFRHALYQQVIYQALSPSTRRRLHQTIGEALEGAYGQRTGQVAGELAVHFERSGDADRAIRHHAEAAAQARSRFAHQEARLHLDTALALLRTQPESVERMRREMPLLHALGSTLFVIRGYGDDGALRAFLRLRELAERLDAAAMRWRAMDGLILAHTVRTELTTARTLAEERLALAGQNGDVAVAAKTRLTIGMILFHLGDAEAARQHAAAVHDLVVQGSPALPPAIGISSCVLLATTYAYLGLVTQARVMNSEALQRATEMDVPYFRAYTTHLAAQVCALLRDVPAARALAEQTAPLAAEYGLSVFGLAATVVRSWCDIQDGGGPSELAAMRAAVSDYAASGQGVTFFSTLLAEAMLACGQVAAAREVVDAALAFGARTEQRQYEHEFHRLRGDCALANGSARRSRVEAGEHFGRALAIAAARGALLFELRAAVSLYGVHPLARDGLARIADRFDVDDDCTDLRAARSLLRE